MGGERARRADTDVYAEDLAKAPNIAGIEPGKRNLVQTYEVGDDYVDKDGVCERKRDAVAGCFLTDRQRDKLISRLGYFVQTAQTNYKLALVELKVAELLKKEEDLHWVLSLALDLAGAHIAVVLGRALKNVQAAGAAKLADLQLMDAAGGTFSNTSWVSRADQMIALVSPARIDAVAKAGMTAAGLGAKAVAQTGVNAATQTTKSMTVSYIAELRDTCDVAFDKFISHASTYTHDAELVVVFEGMKPEYHSVGAYIASLGEKIDRFRKSGVLDIGRKEAKADDYGGTLLRDTRVVYVQDVSGNKVPWYQHQDGASGSGGGHIKPGDPLFDTIDGKDAKHQAAWSRFGARNAGPAMLDRPVPEEFRDVALAHSEARWGATNTIDDGYVTTLKQQGVNVDEMRMRLRGSPIVASSVFPPGRMPWDTLRTSSTAPFSFPPGSVFGEDKK